MIGRHAGSPLRLSAHARRRARRWSLTAEEVDEALTNRELERPGDQPGRLVVMGVTSAGRRLKVVVPVDDQWFVITDVKGAGAPPIREWRRAFFRCHRSWGPRKPRGDAASVQHDHRERGRALWIAEAADGGADPAVGGVVGLPAGPLMGIGGAVPGGRAGSSPCLRRAVSTRPSRFTTQFSQPLAGLLPRRRPGGLGVRGLGIRDSRGGTEVDAPRLRVPLEGREHLQVLRPGPRPAWTG